MHNLSVPARILLLFAVGVFALSDAEATRKVALAPGEQAPILQGITYPVTDRVRIDYSEARVTLINFWATWCLPCREEMPELQRMQDELAEDGLRIVGVFDHWETEEAVSFLEELNVTYTNIQASKRMDQLWGLVTVKPTSYLIDSDGKILRRYVGAMPEQMEGMERDILAVLAGRPMSTQVMPADGTPAMDLAFPTPEP